MAATSSGMPLLSLILLSTVSGLLIATSNRRVPGLDRVPLLVELTLSARAWHGSAGVAGRWDRTNALAIHRYIGYMHFWSQWRLLLQYGQRLKAEMPMGVEGIIAAGILMHSPS